MGRRVRLAAGGTDQPIGEADQFDQGAGALALRAIVGEAFLPGQAAQYMLIDQQVLAGNGRFQDVQLLDEFMQVEEQVLERLIDGFIGRVSFGQRRMRFALAQFGLVAQLVQQIALARLGSGGGRSRVGSPLRYGGGRALVGTISGNTNAGSLMPAPELADCSRRARRSAASRSKVSISAISDASRAAMSSSTPDLRSRLARMASRMADWVSLFSGVLIEFVCWSATLNQ
jgi:hypothetical protein